MQSAALSFSPSISLPRKPTVKPTYKFNPFSLSSSSSSKSSQNFGTLAAVPTRRLNLAVRCSSDSFSVNPVRSSWISSPHPESESDSDVNLKVRATSVPESAGEKPQSKGLSDTLVLGILFGLWYLFNIYFNIYNKQVFPFAPSPYLVLLFVFI